MTDIDKETAFQKVKEVLSELAGDSDLGAYQERDIKGLVEHFNKYREAKEPAFVLSYSERRDVKTLDNVIVHIKTDLLGTDRHNYLWRDDNPADDYERGVLNVIRLIHHRLHSIMDI